MSLEERSKNAHASWRGNVCIRLQLILQ